MKPPNFTPAAMTLLLLYAYFRRRGYTFGRRAVPAAQAPL